MNKNQFVSQLNSKDEVLSPFLVKYIASAEGKDGKSYLNLILADNSGEIEARKWHGAETIIGQIRSGDVVIVNGKMNQFQGRLQMIVSEMSKLNEDQIKREDYIQKSGSAPEAMFLELVNIVTKLEEVYIKDEPHRLGTLGVMTGRTHRAEGVLDLALHDEVGGVYAGTSGAQRGLHRPRTHRGVGVEVANAVLGHVAQQALQILGRVHAGDLLTLGDWRVVEGDVHVQPCSDEAIIDRRQPIRTFGVH